jgi:hypothetical protein
MCIHIFMYIYTHLYICINIHIYIYTLFTILFVDEGSRGVDIFTYKYMYINVYKNTQMCICPNLSIIIH